MNVKINKTVSYRWVNEHVPGKWGAEQSDDTKNRDPGFFGLKKTPVNCRSASKKAHMILRGKNVPSMREEEKDRCGLRGMMMSDT